MNKEMCKIKLILLILSMLLVSCQDCVKFNSKEWKEWVETETTQSLRWEMSKDLLKNYNLNGLKSEDVIDLLGEPDNKNESELNYYLGVSGNGINTGRLIIYLKNDKVINFKIFEG